VTNRECLEVEDDRKSIPMHGTSTFCILHRRQIKSKECIMLIWVYACASRSHIRRLSFCISLGRVVTTVLLFDIIAAPPPKLVSPHAFLSY
jgi:hypothetical protein